MLSNGTPNSSMRQFLQFNAVDDVHSILLQYVPLKDVAKTGEKVNVPILECECSLACNCIAFWTNKQITTVLARRMPARTMKVLVNDSLCLLPCSGCLKEGCHECNQESLLPGEDHPDEAQGSTQRSAVSDILDEYVTAESIHARGRICICIPLHDAHLDNWTKLLISSLSSKDTEDRGVQVDASKALEGYLDGIPGRRDGSVEYNIMSFIVPRLTEILISLVLTGRYKYILCKYNTWCKTQSKIRNHQIAFPIQE